MANSDDDDCIFVDAIYNVAEDSDDDDDVQMVGVLVPPATTTSQSKPGNSSDSVTLHVEVKKSSATSNDSPVTFDNHPTNDDYTTALANELTDWMGNRISFKFKTTEQTGTEDVSKLVKSINDSLKTQTNPDNLEGVPGTSGLASTSNNSRFPVDDTYRCPVVPKPSASATVVSTDTSNYHNLPGVPGSSKVPATNNNYFPVCLPVEDIYPQRSVPSTHNPNNLQGVAGTSGMNQAFGTLSMQDQDKKTKKRKSASKDKSKPKLLKGAKERRNSEKTPKPRARKSLHKVATPPNVAPMSRQNINNSRVSTRSTSNHTVTSTQGTANNPVNAPTSHQNTNNPHIGTTSTSNHTVTSTAYNPVNAPTSHQNINNPLHVSMWPGNHTVTSTQSTASNPMNILINGTLITATNQNIVWSNGNNAPQVSVQQTGNVTNVRFTRHFIKQTRKSNSSRVPKVTIHYNPIPTPKPFPNDHKSFPKDHKPMVRTKLISVPEVIKPTEGIEPETIKLFLPETWSCHRDFELPGCNVVQLSKSDPEYLEVSEIVTRTLHRPIQTIHRVENPYLLTMFLLKKAEMITRFGHCSEQLLFHGTNAANIHNITVNNLDWRRYGKNVGHAYGCGVYFGSTAAVSDLYAKNIMFLVRVLIYWTENGASNTSVPAIGNDTTTSVCGNITVKYDDFSYVPKYMVTFLH